MEQAMKTILALFLGLLAGCAPLHPASSKQILVDAAYLELLHKQTEDAHALTAQAIALLETSQAEGDACMAALRDTTERLEKVAAQLRLAKPSRYWTPPAASAPRAHTAASATPYWTPALDGYSSPDGYSGPRDDCLCREWVSAGKVSCLTPRPHHCAEDEAATKE